MKNQVHIVASCADRKRIQPSLACCLRSHRTTKARSRFQSFVGELERAGGVTTPAVDLYLGPYWATIRELPMVAIGSRLDVTLWVASAGYGLIPAGAQIRSYSATFQVGVPDAVASGESEDSVRDQVAAWWSALASWSGPAKGAPRSLVELVADSPRASLFVVGSPRYVQAMEADILRAASTAPDRVSVISSIPSNDESRLAQLVVPSEAALLPVVGGALPSLHARVARHVLANAKKRGTRTSDLRSHYSRLVRSSDYAGMPQRRPASDAEVMRFVKKALRKVPGLSASPALRMWRGSGRACEHKRFRRLFLEVAAGHDH